MNKDSIIGLVIIFIILIAMPFYYQTFQDDQKTKTKETTQEPQTQQQTTSTASQTSQEKSQQETKTASTVTKVQSKPEKLFTVESKLYKITLSSRGGGTIKDLILKKYQEYKNNDTTKVNLLKDSNRPLKIKYQSISKQKSITLDGNFKIIQTSQIPTDSSVFINKDESFTISYGLKRNNQIVAKKTLTFQGDQYDFDLTTDLTKLNDDIAGNTFKLTWNGGLSYTEHPIKRENRYTEAFAYTSAEEVEDFEVGEGEKDSTEFQGNTLWSSIRNKYFAAAFIPQDHAINYKLSGRTTQVGEYTKKIYDMELGFPANRPQTTQIFAGPLDYDVVTSLNANLDQIMNLGKILKFISRPICTGILISLKTLYKFIPNYGIVIMLFAIFIKIVLSPLTMKSMKSMKEMQKLQPKIQEIKDKYEDEPEKLNKETMKLYRQYGINPMGGCFPMLLQMPILISMFTVIRSTIALRNAHFFGWITNLSIPDRLFQLPFDIPLYGHYFNLLPLVMVITQIFQQKVSGASSNPQGKSMAYLMPIMFFFIFNRFPSGLVLYYTMFNLFTVIQTKWFTPEPELTKQEDANKSKGRLEKWAEMSQQMKND